MASTITFYDNSSILPLPTGLGFDTSGNLYSCGVGDSRPLIKITSNAFGFDASGIFIANLLSYGVNTPIDVKVDSTGYIYVTNFDDAKILKVSPDGTTITTYATLPSPPSNYGSGLVFDASGYLYATDEIKTIYRIPPGGGSTPVYCSDSSLNGAAGLAFDASGYLYCCSLNNDSIFQIDTSGNISKTYTNILITDPEAIVYSSNDGMLYFTNYQTNVCQLNPTTGIVNIYIDAASGFKPQGLAINTSQRLYIGDTTNSIIYRTTAAVCFNEDTKILCLNHSLEEEYVPIQDLKKGDLVKTYLHGYRKVDLIHKGVLFNNPNKWNQCMYKMEKTEENGLLEDLIVTGGHSILVDEFTETEKEKLNKNGVKEYIYKIDDKYLLFASASDHFVPLTDNKKYNYYHLTLENNGDGNQQFGIWANGILTETTCNDYLLNHT